jgi:hypothetical protein
MLCSISVSLFEAEIFFSSCSTFYANDSSQLLGGLSQIVANYEPASRCERGMDTVLKAYIPASELVLLLFRPATLQGFSAKIDRMSLYRYLSILLTASIQLVYLT